MRLVDIGEDAAKVGLPATFSGGLVARLNRGDEVFVLADHHRQVFDTFNHQLAKAVHMQLCPRQFGDDGRASGEGGDQAVKAVVGGVELSLVADRDIGALQGDLVAQSGHQTASVGLFHCAAQDRQFQRLTHELRGFEVSEAQGRNAGAALGQDVDEALLGQPGQRLAGWRAADTERVGQRGLGQFLVRLQFKPADAVKEVFVKLL